MRVLAVAEVAHLAAGRASWTPGAGVACRARSRRVRDADRRERRRQSPRRSCRCARTPCAPARTGTRASVRRRDRAARARRVVGRRHDDEDVREVLGGGAHQARAADVDLLDQRRRTASSGFGGGLDERVEVDDDEVDQGDAVLRRRRRDRRHRPRRARMPPWTSGCSVFTRPSIISGKPVTSEIADDRQPGLLRARGRAAGRHELEAARGKPAGKLDETGLIGNAQKGSGHGNRGTIAKISDGVTTNA